MNKLGRKLFVSISLAIVFIFVILAILANVFLPKYYIFKTKEKLGQVTESIEQMPMKKFLAALPQLEAKYNLTIVYAAMPGNVNQLNEALLQQLSNKRVTLNKFWITSESLAKVQAGHQVNKIYDQGKLKSSFYARFIQKDHNIVLIGLSMAYLHDTIQIMNEFILYLGIISILIMVVIVWILSYRITRPLQELGEAAKEISELKFKQVHIHTGDEIEELAVSINTMSHKLHTAHQDLTRKNQSLKLFMSDITHELKTPISLIQAYAEGMKDGLDDGSYTDTILRQTDSITRLIDELLNVAKIEQNALERTVFSFSPLFHACAEKFEIKLQSKQISLLIQEEPAAAASLIYADPDKIRIVVNNLLSNAMKYTTNQQIEISLQLRGEELLFHMKNGIEQMIDDIHKIWEPFYVLEQSRSKEISGTGLGLAIVKAILDQHEYRYEAAVDGQHIHFYVYMKINNSPTA
ncbi:two-component sensor histidine kinase [Paenibacillus baekrokdamisoli]|uniref:histidine kinase n=1 Tax=Paenibacillus baekrokdamisoli TaxID=1712516 RepID=A0A3G9IUD4_9BACL|nr:HAMP domain-containing sensor histidine kinase [Paenibacillus baekrokdamisoli]MBB3071618.1 signal transduction histidine kinase [Paenibacillus baekrokdamisoli]BBH21872.1 two-component sensor histidine kinase [Paenibacillus baekrokdamisoli]